ncbi:MAG: HK97 family phage prohead protease [bacterium]|nr:HK97 family phage prohead protease [bacterium]
MPMRDIETRVIEVSEIRIERRDDEPPKIFGYSALFDVESLNLGGFVETVAPGAFTKTIKESDIRGLFNHDSNFVLGRNVADTLSLKEDKKGLLMEAVPPDTQWARDLVVSIERGDITGQSFSFRTVSDQWTNVEEGPDERRLLEVELFDVGPVTFPAYVKTDVAVRSYQEWLAEQITCDTTPRLAIRRRRQELAEIKT